MNIEGLVNTILELQNAAASKPSKEIDQKIQFVREQVELVKADIDSKLNSPACTSEFKARFLAIKANLDAAVAKCLPKPAAEIAREEQFKKLCLELLNATDLSPLEAILADRPLDFSAIKLTDRLAGGVSLMTYVLRNAKNDNLLNFLLNYGATFNMKDTQEVLAIMNFLTPEESGKKAHCDVDLLEKFIRAGLDINIAFNPAWNQWQHRMDYGRSTLLTRSVFQDDKQVIRNLVYHGAGDTNNVPVWKELKKSTHHELINEAFALRDEMLQKMQKHLSPHERKAYKDLSIFEREDLAKLCIETQSFRDALLKRGSEVSEKLQERIALHDHFVKACLDGHLEEAEKLLSQGIDINANLIRHPNVESFSSYRRETAFCPLLNHACLQGNVKFVEFLIKHGAKVNIGDPYQYMEWYPPILECAVAPIPNKAEILTLLKNAGADPNEKVWCIFPAHSFLHKIFLKKDADHKARLQDLIKIGVDINVKDLDFNLSLLDCYINLVDVKGFPPGYDFTKFISAAKLFMHHGAKIKEDHLKRIASEEVLKPLADAIRVRNQALNEMINAELGAIAELKPLSMDLINVIGGFAADAQIVPLTPEQQIDLANRCKAKDEG